MEFKLEDIEETFNGEIVNKISNNEYLIKIQDKEHHIQILDINSRGMEFVLDNHYPVSYTHLTLPTILLV